MAAYIEPLKAGVAGGPAAGPAPQCMMDLEELLHLSSVLEEVDRWPGG
jgi:hypothetical protein